MLFSNTAIKRLEFINLRLIQFKFNKIAKCWKISNLKDCLHHLNVFKRR